MKLSLTFFDSLRNPQGRRVNTTWAAVVPRLTSARHFDRKEDAPGLAFATFKGDRRSLANVELVYCVGLDFDRLNDLPPVVTHFAPLRALIHTTWSSTSLQLRARVFLPLSRPVTAAEYRHVYAACAVRAESAALEVDRAASDPSRFWFLPSTPPGVRMLAVQGTGPMVDVELAIKEAPVPDLPRAPVAYMPGPGASGASLEERCLAYLDKCAAAISGSGGHNVAFTVAQVPTRGFGLDEETSYRLLYDWNARCKPPWSSGELRRKVREAAERGNMPIYSLRDARRTA